ncbi:MAG: 16S rRNA processing protein RimM [Lachnospiraceae bacterium]|jgi:16S rRNA processing protein RimM|nr:16S rRNA processing protein RimM [Lachnospiraceae bacterium]MBP5599276.1 16S rRNA processing protein RimM [Lachnospiraceae bacterium]MBR5356495.1 16S rRNA processing protein RimM [Lachnospiraceae bacterium]
MEDLLTVGIITTAHGVHGEVKVYPTTDDVKRFKKCKELILDDGKNQRKVKLLSVKFFKQFVIIKFEGIDTMDDALKLKNASLLVTRDMAVKCEKDEYFIADLIGLKVYDEENNLIGVVSEVYQTGANDVYEIEKEDSKKVLVPAIKDCIKDVDIKAGKMTIHVMEGLFE